MRVKMLTKKKKKKEKQKKKVREGEKAREKGKRNKIYRRFHGGDSVAQ